MNDQVPKSNRPESARQPGSTKRPTNARIAQQLGAALQWFRVEKRWSQEHFAEKFYERQEEQISQSYVSNVEHGRKQLSIERIVQWSDVLGISIVEVFEKACYYARRVQVLKARARKRSDRIATESSDFGGRIPSK